MKLRKVLTVVGTILALIVATGANWRWI